MITIDWETKTIHVPQADLVSLGANSYELNIDSFRLALKSLEDSEEGIIHEVTHRHNPQVNVGGVTLARVVEIINGYTITFENGSYFVNLVGANSNITDVVNLNSVSIRASNSAGMVVTSGSGLVTNENIEDIKTAILYSDMDEENPSPTSLANTTRATKNLVTATL